MRAQKPAEGVLAMREHSNSKTYKVPCQCGCDAELMFDVEVDKDWGITSHIYANTKTNYWRERINISYSESWIVINLKSMFNDYYNRVAIAWTALTKGYVETEVWVMLTEQQALNFGVTLQNAALEYGVHRAIHEQNVAKSHVNDA
jgi:hypothetical protein